MSAGEWFELISPAVFLLSALLSTWVLASARKRCPFQAALGWAIGTLLLPFVVLPLYLASLLFLRFEMRSPRRRLLVPLVYGVIVISAISFYFYRDRQSVDAHLARAVQAKLVDDYATAIREYRRALAIEENAHTRKLLAVELALAGQVSEAASELDLAQKGGEPIACPERDARCKVAVEKINRFFR
jgi:hypothetical protein